MSCMWVFFGRDEQFESSERCRFRINYVSSFIMMNPSGPERTGAVRYDPIDWSNPHAGRISFLSFFNAPSLYPILTKDGGNIIWKPLTSQTIVLYHGIPRDFTGGYKVPRNTTKFGGIQRDLMGFHGNIKYAKDSFIRLPRILWIFKTLFTALELSWILHDFKGLGHSMQNSMKFHEISRGMYGIS